MATSSITAHFHTDDPKAANAIVRALFTTTRQKRRTIKRTCHEVKRTAAGDHAFFRSLVKKANSMKAGVC
jgi:hypothetical protein